MQVSLTVVYGITRTKMQDSMRDPPAIINANPHAMRFQFYTPTQRNHLLVPVQPIQPIGAIIYVLLIGRNHRTPACLLEVRADVRRPG